MKKALLITLLFSTLSSTYAQVIAMTVSSLVKVVQPGDQKMLSKIKGDWLIVQWVHEGADKSEQVAGVMVTFKKCKKKERKQKLCEAYITFPDEEVEDVMAYIGSDKFNFQIDTRKQTKKEAEVAEGIEPDQVPKGQTFKMNGKEYRYSIKYKKKKLYFDTVDIVEQKDNHLVLEKIKKKKKKS